MLVLSRLSYDKMKFAGWHIRTYIASSNRLRNGEEETHFCHSLKIQKPSSLKMVSNPRSITFLHANNMVDVARFIDCLAPASGYFNACTVRYLTGEGTSLKWLRDKDYLWLHTSADLPHFTP